jgi:hypothetical protein
MPADDLLRHFVCRHPGGPTKPIGLGVNLGVRARRRGQARGWRPGFRNDAVGSGRRAADVLSLAPSPDIPTRSAQCVRRATTSRSASGSCARCWRRWSRGCEARRFQTTNDRNAQIEEMKGRRAAPFRLPRSRTSPGLMRTTTWSESAKLRSAVQSTRNIEMMRRRRRPTRI